MAGDLDALLAPISGDQPCGPDLAYGSARIELERAFHSDVSIDTSGRAAKTMEVDWKTVIDGILAEFAQTKDLWLATYMCRAGASASRLDVVALGAEILAGLFERYWDTVHPHLEEVGVAGRRTPCEPLAHKGAFLDPLARAALLTHERFGAFSGETLMVLRGQGAADEAYGPFQLALQDVGDAPLRAAHETLGRIDAALRRADALFLQKSGAENAVDFRPVYLLVAEIRQAIASFYLKPAADEAAAPARGPVEGSRGALNSRDDVVKALDAIVNYYQRREPSSPLLPVLERAKAWVPMSFLDLLADIAPDSLSEATRVLSKRASS